MNESMNKKTCFRSIRLVVDTLDVKLEFTVLIYNENKSKL